MASEWGLNPASVEALRTVAGFIAATLAIRQVDRHQRERYIDAQRTHAALFSAVQVRLRRNDANQALVQMDIDLHNAASLPVMSTLAILRVHNKPTRRMLAGVLEPDGLEGATAFGSGVEVLSRYDSGWLWWDRVVVTADLGWGTLAPGESKRVVLTVDTDLASALRREVGIDFVDGDGRSWTRYLDGRLVGGSLRDPRR